MASGLTEDAAAELGLLPGTPVAAGLIDAHAGGVGTVGGAGDRPAPLQSRMAYVFGTSACTMATTSEPAFVPGVWGRTSPRWCRACGSTKAANRRPARPSIIW